MSLGFCPLPLPHHTHLPAHATAPSANACAHVRMLTHARLTRAPPLASHAVHPSNDSLDSKKSRSLPDRIPRMFFFEVNLSFLLPVGVARTAPSKGGVVPGHAGGKVAGWGASPETWGGLRGVERKDVEQVGIPKF